MARTSLTTRRACGRGRGTRIRKGEEGERRSFESGAEREHEVGGQMVRTSDTRKGHAPSSAPLKRALSFPPLRTSHAEGTNRLLGSGALESGNLATSEVNLVGPFPTPKEAETPSHTRLPHSLTAERAREALGFAAANNTRRRRRLPAFPPSPSLPSTHQST